MNRISKAVGSMLRGRHIDIDNSEQAQICREWDRQRARAMTPSDLSEIDAIFSRNLLI